MNSEIKFWGALISIAVPAIAKVDGEDSGGRELMLGVHVRATDSVLSSHLG